MLVSSSPTHPQKHKAQAAQKASKAAALPKKKPTKGEADLMARYGVSLEFIQKSSAIMKKYHAPVEVLLNIMAVETQGTFSPKIESRTKHAIGLIQFTPDIIEKLKTSKAELAKMTAEKQLKYVDQYFEMTFQERLKTKTPSKLRPVDFYAAVFCPKAIGKNLKTILYTADKDKDKFERNDSVDSNKDGAITLGELYQRYLRYEEKYANRR